MVLKTYVIKGDFKLKIKPVFLINFKSFEKYLYENIIVQMVCQIKCTCKGLILGDIYSI